LDIHLPRSLPGARAKGRVAQPLLAVRLCSPPQNPRSQEWLCYSKHLSADFHPNF
jgi:hypothetical protein